MMGTLRARLPLVPLSVSPPGVSVVVVWRDGRADRLLDLALARLKGAGLVRERTTQRPDSTPVMAAVRDLTRLELITEAVRGALEEVAGISPHLLDELAGRRGLRAPLRPAGLPR